MRVATRGLLVAVGIVAIMALYLFVIAPRLLDRDNMVAPLLYVGLPLWFAHVTLVAILGGSTVSGMRALYRAPASRTPIGYGVVSISFVAASVLAYLYVYYHVLGR